MAEIDVTGRPTADAARKQPDGPDVRTGKADQQAGHLAENAKRAVNEVGSNAGQAALSQVDRRKGRFAEEVHGIGEALRMSAQQLRERGDSAGVQYVERLANQADRVSELFDRKDTREMITEVERFARQNQPLFLGGAFALGLLGARFLKGSPTPEMRNAQGAAERSSRIPERMGEPEHEGVGRAGAPGYRSPEERTTSRTDPKAAGPRRDLT